MKTAMCLLLALSAFAAEFYKLPNIKRLEKDLYRSGDTFVETRFCFHMTTYGETAVLKYDGPGKYSGSTISFEDKSACDVSKVFSAK